ncbi:MAG: hypothetical protein IKD70_07055, partial [Eggerthellaceae bacterium]|nr:hypothetical protein [Eggerthellaceae bacterium]
SPHGAGGETLPCATCHTSHRKSAGIQYCFDSCHHPGTSRSARTATQTLPPRSTAAAPGCLKPVF